MASQLWRELLRTHRFEKNFTQNGWLFIGFKSGSDITIKSYTGNCDAETTYKHLFQMKNTRNKTLTVNSKVTHFVSSTTSTSGVLMGGAPGFSTVLSSAGASSPLVEMTTWTEPPGRLVAGTWRPGCLAPPWDSGQAPFLSLSPDWRDKETKFKNVINNKAAFSYREQHITYTV